MEQRDFHRDFFREILDETGTAVYVADFDTGELVYMNQAMRKIACHGDEDYRGRNCYEYIMNKDAKCENCDLFQVKENQDTFGGMTSFSNGRHYDVTGNLIKWEGRTSRIAFIHDTTQKHDDLKKMEILFNEIPAGIAVILSKPEEDKVTFYNNGFFHILGTTREKWDASGNGMMDQVHPKSREDLVNALNLLNTQNQSEVTIQIVNGMGGYSWIEMKLMVSFRINDCKVIYAIATNIDLLMDTLKAQEEYRGRQEENYLRSLQVPDAHTSPTSFYLHFNLTKDVLIEDKTQNKAIQRNYQTDSYQNFLNSPVFQSPYEKETFNFQQKFQKEALLDQIKHGETRITLGQRTGMEDGLPFWISIKATLIQNPITRDQEVVIYGDDITRQKTRKYIADLMMDTSYDVVLSIDLLHDSARAIHIGDDSGYDGPQEIHGLNEVVGTYIRENGIGVGPEFKDVIDFMNHFLSENPNEQEFQFDYARVDREGNPHAMRGTFYIQDVRNQMLIYLARDVTADWEQHNHYISQYEQVLQEATAAVNERKELATQVYQESKKPLNAILEAVKFLDCQIEDEEGQNCLTRIREACTGLIEGLSDKSGVSLEEFGGKGIYLEPGSMMDSLTNAINKVEVLREQKKIGVVTDIDSSAYDRVMMDRHRYETIFLNLLQGIIECTKTGSRIFCEIERTGESKTNLEQVVRFGCTSSKELTKFLQSTNFSIIQKMVELMGGRLTVTNKNFVEFSIDTNLVKAKPAVVEEEYQNVLYLAGRRLLLVSKNLQGRKLVTSNMEQKGLLSEEADDYEQAMNMIRSKLPRYYDLVIYNSNQMTEDQVRELDRLCPTMGLRDVGQFQFDQVFKNIFSCLQKNLNELS